jgi:hypothetical protein
LCFITRLGRCHNISAEMRELSLNLASLQDEPVPSR